MTTSEGERLRDAGMAAVEAASDAEDIAEIDIWIRSWNRQGFEWSANDLRDELPDVRQPLIGARVRAAAMRKEMVRVGFVPSTLKSTHAAMVSLWKGVAR
jgi:hypothetical protein